MRDEIKCFKYFIKYLLLKMKNKYLNKRIETGLRLRSSFTPLLYNKVKLRHSSEFSAQKKVWNKWIRYTSIFQSLSEYLIMNNECS